MATLTVNNNNNVTSSIREQCTFSSISKCKTFQPHFLRADFCTSCYKKIFDHSSSAVKDDKMVRLGIEFTQKGQNAASQIIKYNDNQLDNNNNNNNQQQQRPIIGGLFLSGFKAVLSKKIIEKNEIGLIVNTAKALGMFWPAYKRRRDVLEKNNIKIIDMNWIDSKEQVLNVDNICNTIDIIHNMRMETGKSVLIHCAQGKSRSTTLTIAYLMFLNGTNVKDTLEFVKTKRAMAQPNENFLKQLQNMESVLLNKFKNIIKKKESKKIEVEKKSVTKC